MSSTTEPLKPLVSSQGQIFTVKKKSNSPNKNKHIQTLFQQLTRRLAKRAALGLAAVNLAK